MLKKSESEDRVSTEYRTELLEKGKRFSLILLSISLLILLYTMTQSVTVEVIPQEGLLNPVYKFGVKPGKGIYLALAASVLALALVLFLAVRHKEKKNIQRQQAVSEGKLPENIPAQPMDLKLLKEAIRQSDVQKVREIIAAGIWLPSKEEGHLTPLELAKLYGDEAIIAEIQAALEKQRASSGSRPKNEERDELEQRLPLNCTLEMTDRTMA